MPVGLTDRLELSAVGGIRVGTASLGQRAEPRDDLTIIEAAPGTVGVGVFTQNAFCAAPVQVAKAHLASSAPRYLIINAGNANAGTGAQGLNDANACCQATARAVGCQPEEVLPFSTGVIGELLRVDAMQVGIPRAFENLCSDGWERGARAILTTDIVPKGLSRTFQHEGRTCTVSGIAKGSGMIQPNMATMLGFVATDAPVGESVLGDCLRDANNKSFNRITVDSDTSTNDACILLATGAAGGAPITADSPSFDEFRQAVTDVCQFLAHAIVRDGEGATKFVTVHVTGGQDTQECLAVAYTVAHSPLVKTALYASDANWGRILAAVGRSGVSDLDVDAITIRLGDVLIAERGGRAASYTEEAGQAVMAQEEITITIDLARGPAEDTVWTCDFSYEYVRINAEYRT